MSKYEANMKDEIKRIIQESNDLDWTNTSRTKESALLDSNINALYEGYQSIKNNPNESWMISGIEEYVLRVMRT